LRANEEEEEGESRGRGRRERERDTVPIMKKPRKYVVAMSFLSSTIRRFSSWNALLNVTRMST
jgi:hypothetical protein